MNNIDEYIIYKIFSYLKPSRDKLCCIRHIHPAYNIYKQAIEKKECTYLNQVLYHVCKTAFYMDIISDDYKDYEDFKNYLEFINNIPYFRNHDMDYNSGENSGSLYSIGEFFKIFKDLEYYLTSGSIDTIPIEYKYNKTINVKRRVYKKNNIYSENVYALLLID
jgi:hypothetical protein